MSYMSEDEHRARIPVAIVSGFLGSGKTTLINAVLRDPRFARTAVAINEFGEVPIDQHLIDHGDDQTIVMANGCLCCNLAGDMEEAVMRVFARSEHGEIPSFDRMIIEPSGLSDPAPIAQALLRQPLLSRAFALHPLIVVVDAGLVSSQLRRYPEVRKQIELADTILVTKIDLVDEAGIARVGEELRTLNPAAAIRRAASGGIDPAEIFAPSFYDLEADIHPAFDLAGRSHERDDDTSHGHDHAHGHGHRSGGHGDIVSLSLTADIPLPWRPLEKWLRYVRIQNRDRLIRLKGLVNTKGSARPLVIQAVEHVQSVPVELSRWPDEDRRSRLVLIGKDLDVADIARSWSGFCRSVSISGVPTHP